MSYNRETWVDNTGPPFLGAVKLNAYEAAHADASTFMSASGGRLASAIVLASGGQHVLGASALMTPGLASAVPGLLYVASGTVAQPTVNAPLYRSDGTSFRKIAPGIVPVVANLPANPNDGDEIYFLADATNGVMWHLRYRAGSASAFKWEFIGGQPLAAQATAQVALTTISAFADFSDASPTIALPLSGDYDLEYGAHLSHSGNGQGILHQPVATGLAAGTVAAYLSFTQAVTTNSNANTVLTRYRAANISGTLKMQYFVGLAGGTSERRKLFATPVRVG